MGINMGTVGNSDIEAGTNNTESRLETVNLDFPEDLEEHVSSVNNDVATVQTSASTNNNDNTRVEIWKRRLRSFGLACFNKMDYIGGYVAYFLGVEDSRYQWVIDSMDEEDMARARQDYLERRAKDQVLFAEMGIDTGLPVEEENPEIDEETGEVKVKANLPSKPIVFGDDNGPNYKRGHDTLNEQIQHIAAM